MRIRYLSAILLAALYAVPVLAGTSGVGTYVTGGYGVQNWIIESSTRLTDFNISTKIPGKQPSMVLGAGLVADSNLNGQDILNFRFKAGYQHRRSSQIRQDGFSTNLILGLAPVRESHIRFWLGPMVLVNYYKGKARSKNYAALYWGTSSLYGPIPFRRKFDTFQLGGGLAMGINFNLTDFLTLSLDFAGTAAKGFGTGKDLGGAKAKADNSAFDGTATVAVLFRPWK